MDPFVYVKPTEQSVADIKIIREECERLHNILLGVLKQSREKSLAITKLEEVSMWANKGVVFNQVNE